MAETLEQRRARLAADGFVDPSDQSQQVDTIQQPQDNNTWIDAALTGARRSIGSTAGGLTGGAIGGLLAPETFGLSLALPIIGGYIGSQAGGEAQSAIEPTLRGETEEQTQARLQKEQLEAQAHPIATEVGEIAPNLVAFRPDADTLSQAFTGSKTALSSLGNTALSAAQKAAIDNIGLNAAIGAGSSVAQNLQYNQPVDYAEAAKQAVINAALFHEPWLAGTHIFGFHPSADLAFTGNAPSGGINLQDSSTVNNDSGYTKPIGLTPPLSVEAANAVTKPFGMSDGEFDAYKDGLIEKAKEDIANNKLGFTPKNERTSATGSDINTDDDSEPTTIMYPAFTKRISYNDIPIVGGDTSKIALPAPTIEPSTTFPERDPSDIKVLGNINETLSGIANRTKIRKQDFNLATTEDLTDALTGNNISRPTLETISKNPQKTNTKRMEAANVENAKLTTPSDNEFQKAGNSDNNADDETIDKFSKGILDPLPEGPVKVAFKVALDKYKADPTKGFVPPDLSPEGLKKAANTVNKVNTQTKGDVSTNPKEITNDTVYDTEGNPLPSESINPNNSNLNIPKPVADYLQKRGFTVKGGNLIGDSTLQTPSGETAAGKFTKSNRNITLNTEAAGKDTATHEVIHSVINDAVSDPKTKPFMDRILTTLGGTADAHPEASVDKVGKIVDSNIKNGIDAPFWKTLVSNVKLKLGGGNETDAINALVAHSQDLAPHSELTKRYTNKGGAGIENQQDQKIKDLYDKMSQFISSRAYEKLNYPGTYSEETQKQIKQFKDKIAAVTIQDRVLKSFQDEYTKRDVFKNITVNKNPKVDGTEVNGFFNSETGETVSKPDKTDTALHEATHNIFNKNKLDINNLTSNWINKTPVKDVVDTLRNVGESLETQHEIYGYHNKDLMGLANALEQRGSTQDLSLKAIDTVRHALDEITAQTSSQDFKAEKDITTSHKFISSIMGEDFFNHIATGNKSEQYYPKYRNAAKDNINQLQTEMQRAAAEHIANPSDVTRDNLQKAYSKFELSKRNNLGEYYQKSQLQSPDDEVNNIHLGAHDELAKLDTRTSIQKLKDTVNPFRVFRSDIKRIQEIPAKEGKYVAGKLSKQMTDALDLQGKYRGLIEALSPLDSKERDLLNRTGIQEFRSSTNLRDTLPPKLQTAYDTIRKTLIEMQQDKINSGEMVKDFTGDKDTGKLTTVMRLPKVDPNYWPNMSAGHVYEALAHPGSELYNKLKQDFIDWQEQRFKTKDNYSKNATNNMFNDLVESLGQAKGNTSATRFGANRFAEGIGLPDSWIEPDLLLGMRRYLRRSTNDMSFFNNIEKDPVASRIIGMDKNQVGIKNPTHYQDGSPINNLSMNQDVRNILDYIQGNVARSKNPTMEAGLNLAKTLLLGPVSGFGVHVLNVPFTMAKYAAFSDMPTIVKDGFTNYKEGLQHSYENGFNRKDPTLINDLMLPTTKAASKLYQARNIIYTVNGRRAIEVFGKSLTQSMAESLLRQNLVRASNGEKQALSFFQKDLGLGKFDPIDVSNRIPELAKRIGEFVQGSYDPRNLPSWALNSSISPIFSLARWSIEQTNHFNDHVISPARRGNFQPLLVATLGSVVGGYLINKLKEEAYDKKSYLPSLQEMVASSKGLVGNKANAAYTLMSMASYAGYAGILGDLARAGMDVVNHNNPQSYNFPAWGMITDTVTRVGQAAQALIDGKGDYATVGTKLVGDLMLRNIQLARLVNTWILEKGGLNNLGKNKADLSNKERDVSVFKKVNGIPTSASDPNANNPYENLDIQEFKKTGDLNRAAQLLPFIIDRVQKNNPDNLQSSLTGLRAGISYNTIPKDTRNMPNLSSQYLQFIAATQGKDAANALLQDYITRNAINKAKANIIPHL